MKNLTPWVNTEDCPPPCEGWWETSTSKHQVGGGRRWWNGNYWSMCVRSTDSDKNVEYLRSQRGGPANHEVYWRGLAEDPNLAAPQTPVTAADCESRSGWLEASIAWGVAAAVHARYANGRDPFFKTRQSDYVKHADSARAKYMVNLDKQNLAKWAEELGSFGKMVVCSQCGNKRCPRATSNAAQCSGSNALGQDQP
jgi:hypothetical protein